MQNEKMMINLGKKAGYGGIALLVLVSSGVSAGIFNTKHNLGANGPNAVSHFQGTTEICVFCHTPHGGDATASPPLWNRHNDFTGFTTYDQNGSTTLDAAIEPVGSVSVACLTCHDGSQAMDSVINEPGSGRNVNGFNESNWLGQAAKVNGHIGDVNIITNLGKDLRDDHPVGVQFAGGGYSDSSPAGGGRDPDFHQAKSVIKGTSRFWWVDSKTEGSPASFEKTDLKLYTRVGTRGVNAGQQQPYVECASCHDPHVDYNPTFLRIDPKESNLCLSCHNK